MGDFSPKGVHKVTFLCTKEASKAKSGS